MQDQARSERPPCGACFEAGADVTEETFPDKGQAFNRFTLLFNAGDSPALCRKDNQDYHVCHREQAACRRPWPYPPRAGG